MSVIAWDGVTLAADTQSSNQNLFRRVTKIWRHEDMLIAGAGAATTIQAIRNWVLGGCEPKDWPSDYITKDDNTAVWIINKSGRIAVFEGTPYPIPFEDKIFADGSGRDFALGAMAMGAGAHEAVTVACKYDIYCGGHIDTLTFGEEL